MTRFVSAGFVLGALSIAVVACQSAKPSCLEANCSGCCASDGTCQDGTTPQACGSLGLACVACDPNSVCNSGTCSPSGTDGGSGTDAGPGRDAGRPNDAGTNTDAGQGNSDGGQAISYCILQYPPNVVAVTGATTNLVYGRVYAQGITDGTGQGPGITAQVGWGPQGSDPSGAGWTWTTAAYNTKYGHNDEYQASMTAPAVGTYSYLYRFSYQGEAYVYCDLNGGSGALPVTNPGVLDSVTPPHIHHVFVIAMENQDASQIYGNTTGAPYINNTLMAQYGYASNFQDEMKYGANPLCSSCGSEPHYIWMESGTNTFSDFTFTTDDDASAAHSTNSTAHLVTQIRNLAGDSWISYQENLPAACPISSNTPYAAKHNPFIFFQDVSGNPPSTTTAYCGSHYKDFSAFASDLGSPSTLPKFVFITPNLCDDMHGDASCTNGCTCTTTGCFGCVNAGNNWLQSNLPQIITFAAANEGIIFITWDEGENSPYLAPFVIVGPNLKAGYVSSVIYTHSSMLKSIEEILVLPQLPTVTNANDFGDFFMPGSFP